MGWDRVIRYSFSYYGCRARIVRWVSRCVCIVQWDSCKTICTEWGILFARSGMHLLVYIIFILLFYPSVDFLSLIAAGPEIGPMKLD